MNYTDEEFHQITIDETYNVEFKPNMFAVSRIFAEAHKQMTAAEYKTFALALSRIEWEKPCPDTLYLDKKEVAEIVGINSDPDHLSVDLNRAIGEMPKHSFLKFSEKAKGLYVNGNFVRTIAMFKNIVRIRLEEEFLGLFGDLQKDRQYITMWLEDIKGLNERAILFYELLRDNSDTRISVNEGTVSIKKFKEMFEIPKDGPGSYMRGNQNHFDRSNFEKYVIDPVCESLTKTSMIRLILQPDGKYYQKIKKGNRVIAYKFFWALSMHPAVATAAEMKELREEVGPEVGKDPVVLKVAKDIVAGKKKPKAKKQANNFHNFTERETDYQDLIDAFYEGDAESEVKEEPKAQKKKLSDIEEMDRRLGILGTLPGQLRIDLDGNITEEGAGT